VHVRIRTCIHVSLHVFNQRSITRLRHLSLINKGQKATGDYKILDHGNKLPAGLEPAPLRDYSQSVKPKYHQFTAPLFFLKEEQKRQTCFGSINSRSNAGLRHLLYILNSLLNVMPIYFGTPKDR